MDETVTAAPADGAQTLALARLRLVRSYFDLAALTTGAVTLITVAGLLFPERAWHTRLSSTPLGILAGTALTFAFLRTSHLLRRQRRSGAGLAALCLTGLFFGAVRAAETGWTTIVLAGVGLTAIAAVWRYLK